jgi:hypothetical protein
MPVMTEAHEGHKLDLAAQVLSSGGAIRLQALGTSMLPSIWPSDVLHIEKRPGEEIAPGDIVLVTRESRFFVHRLVEKRGAQWITRGDSLPQNDPPVGEAEVLGKVSTIRRKGGTIFPNPRVALLVRTLAWMLCYSDSFRNIAVRIHLFWQWPAPLSLFLRTDGRFLSSVAPVTRIFDTHGEYLRDCGE